jgi:hypothetical protein
MFELNYTSQNYRHLTDMLEQLTCHVVLDTLADTTSGHVVVMTETCRRHVADTTQNVTVWTTKLTRRHPT